jgi:ComF family protein
MRTNPPLIRLTALAFPGDCAGCGVPLLEIEEEADGLCAGCRARLAPDSGPACPSCGRPLISEIGRCIDCRRRPDPSFDAALALLPYAGLPKRLLAAYKFAGRRQLAGAFADIAAEGIARLSAERGAVDAVVPVPPRPGKLHAQGWDQVDWLVERLPAGTPPVRRTLRRLPSRSQKELDRAGRLANLNGKFVCAERPPASALLVDDVATTGATLEACAASLRAGGCRRVLALALCYD